MFLLSPLTIGLLLIAYLVGAIPTALWVGKSLYSLDLREHGSRNAGATNTIRVLGLKAGIPVLLFDILKGFATTQLAYLTGGSLGSDALIQVKLLMGLIGVMGHLFPVFASFRGGKGIATLLGVFLGIHPLSALVSLGIFAAAFAATRIVSLGSLLAVTAYPFITWFGFGVENLIFTGFAVFFVVVVWYTHRENLKRLIKGEEKKIRLG